MKFFFVPVHFSDPFIVKPKSDHSKNDLSFTDSAPRVNFRMGGGIQSASGAGVPPILTAVSEHYYAHFGRGGDASDLRLFPSRSHPSRAHELPPLAKGYDRCGAQLPLTVAPAIFIKREKTHNKLRLLG
ncbi:hypothetical protein AVEN_125878-1 [Araneus ventricosus]|uniref:Uncharacterized protein n=1 Tax=Araneus ventricosus TaxID=182803 RepID=A0A4Y2F2W1_ARAVE|nr:hypothetical protein AVEN_125878-1 [Araneus ventricosus]